MNRQEYLLSCLIEEASEVIKDVCKSQRFGMNSVNPYDKNKVKNKELILNEIIDFLAVAEMLVEEGIIDDFNTLESVYEKEAKKEKVEKYIKQSIKIGTLLS